MVKLRGHHDAVEWSQPPADIGVGKQPDDRLDDRCSADDLELVRTVLAARDGS